MAYNLFNERRKKWRFVSFEGTGGGESRGIVDFIAIRRNHKFFENPIKIGDYFEIILIQVKGDSASNPSPDDNYRLLKVGQYYHAKQIILSSWKMGKSLELYRLVDTLWEPITPKDAFE